MAGGVLVTGGPTRAQLDEVRYLSNYSTGQLAFKICEALKERGLEVHAVIGPCAPKFENLGLASLTRIHTVHEMLAACLEVGRHADWGVFAAAVLDFEPSKKAGGKVSSKGDWTITLKPTPKVIDSLQEAFPKMRRIGFKLEWELPRDSTERDAFALAKMQSQNLQGLVLNGLASLSEEAHPACLYSVGAPPIQAHNKGEIAHWITRQIAP